MLSTVSTARSGGEGTGAVGGLLPRGHLCWLHACQSTGPSTPGWLSPREGDGAPAAWPRLQRLQGVLSHPELCKPNHRFCPRWLASAGTDDLVPERWMWRHLMSPLCQCLRSQHGVGLQPATPRANCASSPSAFPIPGQALQEQDDRSLCSDKMDKAPEEQIHILFLFDSLNVIMPLQT